MAEGQASNDFIVLMNPCKEFMKVMCYELKLDKVVEWLSEKLNKYL